VTADVVQWCIFGQVGTHYRWRNGHRCSAWMY
jgi:hypothetical protein